MLDKLHFSSQSDEWATPPELFADLSRLFGPFDLDPCATTDNALCEHFFTREDNGLAQDWGTGRVYMNPPYGRHIGTWLCKALYAAQLGALVVCLVPARTDTVWWHTYTPRAQVRFLRGRLSFTRLDGRRAQAPFPSAILIFEPPSMLGGSVPALLP
jgi:site-specific DNA-methyltransferase (adenine-specific)